MHTLMRKGMTKKAYAQKMRAARVATPFNTGSRSMKSAKDYSRAEGRKICQNYN